MQSTLNGKRVIFFSNTGWYLYNFRLSLIEACRNNGAEVVLLCPKDDYTDRLQNLGFYVKTIEFERKSINFFQDFRVILTLRKLQKSKLPTIVHSFTLRCIFLSTMAGLFGSPYRNVHSFTGMGFLFSQKSVTKNQFAKFLLGLVSVPLRFKSNRVIVQNPDDFKLLAKTFIPPTSITLIPGSGVDIKHFSKNKYANLTAQQNVTVLIATRILADKGIHEFIEAAKIIGQCKPLIKFLIAGKIDEGNPSSIKQSEVDAWKALPNIDFLGHQENMLAVYRRSDIVVLPSYREGLPKTLIEACSCGLPIIATDVPGCNHVVQDGENGFLVPIRDAKNLAEKIVFLSKSFSLRERMGKNGRRKAEQLYDQKVINEKTIRLYL